MFWRFGGYASVSTIDTILEKDNFSLEDLLDESDLIQELKSHNAKLIEYLREDKVLEKLLDYVVAPKLAPVAAPIKDEEKVKSLSLSRSRSRSSSRAGDPIDDEADQEKKRNRYAYIAAEILASDNWSINEALMESKPLLRNFWHFLKRPVPLDPLQASYFTKVNESLFDKKTEDMLGLLKTLDGAVADMLKHVDCPMIMDLLLRIISLERQPVGQGVVEWLYTQDLMPTLLSFLGPEHNWATQTSAGDFMKAIITVSANASQNEQTCIGPNELTRQLVSKPCVEQLIKYMLGGGNALTCGVGIIIEVIRKNNSDYDPDGLETGSIPSSRDPIYLGTLLRLFAQHVPDFMNLIMNRPAQRERHVSTFGAKIEPLGFDRFKTCELMAELLHCSNMGLLNDVGSEEFIAARDAQRNKLRAEGRLLSTRGEEAQSSPEDLEMRVSHSSPVAETRKLEVTNTSVDDDGFEEVSHTGDDENSHGVEELPDLLSQAASEDALATLLNTDDDFVDEPLSSPRLIVRELEGKHDEEQVPSEKPHDEKLEQAAGTGENPVPDPMDTDDIPFQPTQHISSPEPPNKKMADLVVSSPHDSAAELDAAPSTEKSSEDQPAVAKDAEVTVAPDTTQGESGEVSINVNHISRPTTPIDDSPVNSRPVVGDYLKLQFVEHGVVPSILGFFFSYPWNNFLHNVVYDIVQQVFNGPMDRGQNPALAMSLFEAADITNQIINGQLASEKSQAETKTRMGYMGHLTLIAEEVVKFTERHPAEILSEVVLEKVMAQDWINYVEGALAETRERDNAILGGVRPEVAMSNRAGASGLAASGISGLGSIGLGVNSSSALADAGLNGSHELSENTGVIGPFAISAGTLMSGFGSSSDEDDDEEQENEEDVNNEFRAYTDPLNSNSLGSMNPPSIPPPPPPPPPLNIPPSRARLQLAARLAMNKRNAAAAANGSQEVGSPSSDDASGSGTFSNLPNVSANDRMRNPFADDEDEDEDRAGSGSGSDDGDVENVDGDGVGSSAWNRGSWWRGVVRSARGGGRKNESGSSGRGGSSKETTIERFGDGRDDSDDSDGRGDEDDEEEMEDEEFGDFAMPEVMEGGAPMPPSSGGLISGIDPAREKILLKPLPLHPTTGSKTSVSSPFGGLWPFSSQGFGSKEKKDENDEPSGGDSGVVDETLSEEPIELGDDGMIGEDGKRIDRAIEAKRRTSIEDPDDDEVVIGEEIISVGRVHVGSD